MTLNPQVKHSIQGFFICLHCLLFATWIKSQLIFMLKCAFTNRLPGHASHVDALSLMLL